MSKICYNIYKNRFKFDLQLFGGRGQKSAKGSKNQSTGFNADKARTDMLKADMASRPLIVPEDEYAKQLVDKATKGYVGTPGSFDINRILREGKLQSLRPRELDIIKNMDNMMRPLTQDVNLHRFVSEGFLYKVFNVFNAKELDNVKNKFIGKTFADDGFVSTSYDTKRNLFSLQNNIHLNIRARKGTKAIITNNIMESEVILNRGSHFTVKSIKVSPGRFSTSDPKVEILLEV